MTRREYGVWEVSLPPKEDGQPAIPHNSKVKVLAGVYAYHGKI